jgi:glycosyltransferase involved in cell wall biosynthesis
VRNNPAGCEVAVVIPAYRQPGLLAEAVLSALDQQDAPPTAVVVVDDGCPYPATARTAADLAAAHPGRVFVLRQPNRGLSAARNAGVGFALAAFPGCRAVYFLDADNRLLPRFLGRAMAALDAAPAGIGWIYPDIDEFGGRENWTTGGDFSLLQLLLTNYCDAGSLVRRAMFEAGLRFDEAMRAGFEDWDFWLAAARQGWRGQHLPGAGFLYRRRPESMLAGSERIRPLLLGQLRQKHAALLAPQRMLALEAAEAPRHAIHLAGESNVLWTLDPAAPLAAPLAVPLAETLDPGTARRRLAAAMEVPGARFHPPVTVFAEPTTLALLDRFALLHLVFWWAGRLLAEADAVALEIIPTTRPELALERPGVIEGLPAEAPLIVTTSAALWAAAARPGEPLAPRHARLRLHLPLEAEAEGQRSPTPARQWALEVAALGQLRRGRSPRPAEWKREYRPPRAGMAAEVAALAGLGPLLPRAKPPGQRDIGFILPLFSFAGLEKVILNQARALRGRGWRTHLIVLGAGRIDRGPDFAGAFDSLSLLEGLGEGDVAWEGGYFGAGFSRFDRAEAAPEVLGLLAGLDVAVNVHSLAAQGLMASLRRLGVRCFGGLHLMEHGGWGEPHGTPHIQAAYEHAYDGVMVISAQLRDWCVAAGVPAEKLHLVRNAPGYATPPSQVAAALAARRRRASGPLKLLFLGRLDAQKGIDRLAALIARTPGEAVQWRIVGRAVLGEAAPPLPMAVEPPVFAPAALDALYAWADVLVLPSRFEGVPLVVLEAQRMGCVPIATDVGAMAEAITHGSDGLLVPHDAPEEVILAGFTEAIAALAADRARLRAMGEAAAARIAGAGWEVVMREFLDHLDRLCPPGEAA